MEKIIVTSARGLMGLHTLPFLNERRYDIHAITSKEITIGLRDDVIWHSVHILAGNKTATARRITNTSVE